MRNLAPSVAQFALPSAIIASATIILTGTACTVVPPTREPFDKMSARSRLSGPFRLENEQGGVVVVERNSEGFWRAHLTSSVSSGTIAAEDCPGLQQAMQEFSILPSLSPTRPYVEPGRPIPLPPSRKDGHSWRLTTSLHSADHSETEVVVKGSGGPYIGWADDLWGAVLRCAAPPR